MPAHTVTKRSGGGRSPKICAPGFVGRGRELAAMSEALDTPPAVVLVEGEAGIGKSTLVRQALVSPAPRRALVAVCPPFRQPFTLGPVVDALRQATEDVRGLRLSALAGALRPLLPEWAAALPPAPEPLEDATAWRHRLFRALAELLGHLGVGLLVVEDVHWADEATLEFLLFLTTRSPQPVSLLVTYRPEDAPAGSLLRRLTSRLPAGMTCARIQLGPLDAPGTASLVSSMLGGEHVSEEFAAFLHEHTDGVPLAVEESVRLLVDRADLICHGGQWERRSLAEIEVPPTVRDAVLERVERLGSSAQAVLRAAAVLTDPAGEPVLTAVTRLADGRVRTGVAETLGSGLLREDVPGLLGFRHALACRAVYEAIPAPERRRLHLRAAQALEILSPLPVMQLARHFREAGVTGEWFRYAEHAADLALTVGGDKTAAELLRDLVTNAAPSATSAIRLTRKIPLYALTGYAALGDLANCLRVALDSDALTPAERAEGQSQLGQILLHAGDYPAGVAELERAIPGLAHRPVEAARAMVRLGWPERTLWPAAVHRQWLDQAAAVMRASSIPADTRMELTVNQATALLHLGEESGWAVAARIPVTVGTPREAEHIVRGCMNIGNQATNWGRYDEARRRLTAGLVLADRHEYPRLRYGILGNLVRLDWFTGAWSGLAGRVEALSELADVDPQGRTDTVLIAGLLDAAAGARAAEDRLRQALDQERRSHRIDALLEPAAVLARLCVADGRVGDALELTDEAMRVITGKGIWLWATDIAPVRVQALAAAGRCEEATRLVRAFARGLRGRDAPAPRAALATCRAILAEGMGDAARASRLFARAAATWRALPRPYDALLAQERQARSMLAGGQQESGLSLLAEVRQGLSDLGASGDAGRAVRVLRDNGVKGQIGRAGRPSSGDRLSPRELEVVRLLVAGQTDRQIADTLFLSPHTVAYHLVSARRKLKAHSRIALVATAIEAGILTSQPGPRTP